MLRVLVVSLLGLLPAIGHAQNPLKAFESRFESAIGAALGYLRSEKPKRGLDLNDNLNLWQPGLGLGAQVEMTKNLSLRLDVDRYRPKFPGSVGRENLDTFMVGIQYVAD
jgi:hypothetical protein